MYDDNNVTYRLGINWKDIIIKVILLILFVILLFWLFPRNDMDIFYDNIYTNISDTQHEVSCSCGEIISIRDHRANGYSYVNSLEHGVYCVCGLLLSYEPHRKVSSGLKTYCRDCGHIFSGSGFTPGIMSGNDGFVNE
jgi:hypothetical protein